MQSFWKWFVRGAAGGPAGIRNVFNGYLIVHITVALTASLLMKSDPFSFAARALFPAASILIGMSIAWTTRASTILQSQELREALFQNDRSAEEYVYGFQLAILIIIIMVAYVAVMAGGGLEISVLGQKGDRLLSGFWLYFLLSLALRECWGVVNFTNMLTLLDYLRQK